MDTTSTAAEWKCVRCSTVLPSIHSGQPPIACLTELGGCGRIVDEDCYHDSTDLKTGEYIGISAECEGCKHGTTRFFPSTWSDAKVQLYIDSELSPGGRLFGDVERNLRRHFYLKEDWQYRILSLYVLQCPVAKGLPGVFYIGLGGTKGSGKTTLQAHIAKIAGGHIYSNVSIAAFARTMKFGDNVCIDEVDESKGAEYDSIRGALLRDGYKSNGPKYDRWDYKKGIGESFSVYGPKIFGYRGGLEDALRSRTFPIPTVKPAGLDGAKYVRANLWPEDDGLPAQLEEWGKTALEANPSDLLKRTVDSDTFQAKLDRAVREIGANRETELSTIALLVAEMAQVDIVDDLRAANEAMASVGEPEPLEQLRVAVRALLEDAKRGGKADMDGTIRLRQLEVRANVNGLRLNIHQKPLTDFELARWRRDLGVDDNLLSHPQNKTVWVLPPGLVQVLTEGDDET